MAKIFDRLDFRDDVAISTSQSLLYHPLSHLNIFTDYLIALWNSSVEKIVECVQHKYPFSRQMFLISLSLETMLWISQFNGSFIIKMRDMISCRSFEILVESYSPLEFWKC